MVTGPSHNGPIPRESLASSSRSRLRRRKDRGSHERSIIDAVLDEGLICHVGFNDGHSTFVLPTAYARVGDRVYLHGASGNHMLRVLASGVQACVTVTLLDGLVFARSAFHHSMNYRCVVLFGSAQPLMDVAEKSRALIAIVEHMARGRTADVRPPTESELRSTLVVSFLIQEGSAKVRQGGPVEDPEDLGLPVWAGELPFETVTKDPISDRASTEDISVPSYVARYSRGIPAQRQGAG